LVEHCKATSRLGLYIMVIIILFNVWELCDQMNEMQTQLAAAIEKMNEDLPKEEVW